MSSVRYLREQLAPTTSVRYLREELSGTAPVTPKVSYLREELSGTSPSPKVSYLREQVAGTAPVVVSAPANRNAGPGEAVSLTATASGGLPSWSWRIVLGPAVSLTGSTTATVGFTAPHLTPPGTTPLILGVTATVNGVTQPEQTVTITVLPQTVFSWDGTQWVGAALAPA